MKRKFNYVLITAARNEEEYIGQCIEAVLAQSVLPLKWVIVSDSSTDNTEKIINNYLKDFKFIKFLRKEPMVEFKRFASKVIALNMGLELLNGINYSAIGHLDADITVQNNYYGLMLKKFEDNPALGIAGGYVYEVVNGAFKSRATNSPRSVAGGIQLFQRKCYQDIGGLIPMQLGGEDWHAEIQAQMHGWEVKAFPEAPVFHHKSSIGRRGMVKEAIRSGAIDYAMGTHILFEIFKCIRRIKGKPYFVFAFIWLYGYFKQYFTKQPRQVNNETLAFLRSNQMSRIRDLLYLTRKRNG